jgi:hypothetical protein
LSANGPATPGGTDRRLVGSELSRRQLGRAAVDGRAITFFLTRDWSISGYLVGMDDFHWFIVDLEQGSTLLLHKGLIPCLAINSDPTLQGSPHEARVMAVGSKFLNYCAESFAPTRRD